MCIFSAYAYNYAGNSSRARKVGAAEFIKSEKLLKFSTSYCV